jgi:site-specific DNA-methyltransferase (adenine-specific)
MSVEIIQGDCLTGLDMLASGSVHTCVTSPPYFGLRDYGVAGQIGLEDTPDAFVGRLVEVFREVWRVLRDDGTLWLNLGDSYSRSPAKGGSGPNGKNETRWGYGTAQSAKIGSSDGAVGRGDRPGNRSGGLGEKQLLGIPWRVAFALQADGWYLRQDIIWHKPNPMPESVKDRCTKAHEYIFMLTKSPRYYFSSGAMQEPAVKGAAGSTFHKGKTATHQAGRASEKDRVEHGTRNRRSVWTVTTKPFKGAHFATFPPDLIEPCILAGAPAGGTVLDPFFGSGTTGLVAAKHGRKCVGIELNPEYVAIAKARLGLHGGVFG